MTDVTPEATPNAESDLTGVQTSGQATPQSIVVNIKTSDSLDQARLEEIARECMLPYSTVNDGIEIICADQATADFWTTRGAFWQHQYDEPTAPTQPVDEEPAPAPATKK